MLARIPIIWVRHGLPHNFNPGLRNLNSLPLTKFLNPVAQFAKQLNLISNKEDFVWCPHLDTITFLWPFSYPPMWVKTYSVFMNERLTTQELNRR